MEISKDTTLVFSSKFLNTFLVFLGLSIFSKKLGAEQMGIFFLFESLLHLLSIPTDFGLRGSIEKRLSEKDPDDSILGSAILLKFIPLSLVIFTIFLVQKEVNSYLGANLHILLIIVLIAQEVYLGLIKILSGEKRVGETAIVRSTRQGVWIFASLLLLDHGYGIRAIIYGLLIGMLVAIFIAESKRSTSIGTPNIKSSISLFDYAKYNFISVSVGGFVNSWIDVSMIALFMGPVFVGAYETAWRISAIVLLFSNAIGMTIFPKLSELGDTKRIHEFEELLSESVVPSLMFVIPCFFGVVAFRTEILKVLFGSSFTIASTALVILMIERSFRSIHVIFGHALQAIDRPDLAMKAVVVSIILNIFLNYILVQYYGLVGAAIATSLSFFVNFVLHVFYLSSYIQFKLPVQEVLWCTLASLLMFFFATFIKSYISIQTIPELILTIFVCGLIYLIIITRNNSLNNTIRSYVTPFSNMIKTPKNSN